MYKMELHLENYEEILIELVYSDYNNVTQRCEAKARIISDKPRTLQIEIQDKVVFHQISNEDIYASDFN